MKLGDLYTYIEKFRIRIISIFINNARVTCSRSMEYTLRYIMCDVLFRVG